MLHNKQYIYFTEKKKKQKRKVYIIQHKKKRNLVPKMKKMTGCTVVMIDATEIGNTTMTRETGIDIVVGVIGIKIDIEILRGETRIGGTEIVLDEVTMNQDLKMNLALLGKKIAMYQKYS